MTDKYTTDIYIERGLPILKPVRILILKRSDAGLVSWDILDRMILTGSLQKLIYAMSRDLLVSGNLTGCLLTRPTNQVP